MDTKKSIVAVVILTVCITLIGSMLAPIISDAQDSVAKRTHTNTGAKVTYMDVKDDYTIVPTTTGWTVNGEDVASTDSIKFFCTDTIISAGYSNLANVNADFLDLGSVVNGITNISLVADGTATLTKGEDTYSTTWNWFVLSNDDGDYVLTNESAYVPEGSLTHWIYPVLNAISPNGVGLIVDVDNGTATLESAVSRSSSILTDISENCSVAVSTSDYETTVTVTYSDTEYSMGAIVPASVVITENESVSPLLGAIIPMLIVGMVISVVAIFLVRRD